MRLQFWYSKGVKQWHWTLHTRHYAPKGQNYYHTSGSGTDVREVMDKVATEVEQLVDNTNNETNTRIELLIPAKFLSTASVLSVSFIKLVIVRIIKAFDQSCQKALMVLRSDHRSVITA